jgi:hypothetical protein
MLVWGEVMRFYERKLSTPYNFCVLALIGAEYCGFCD